MLLLIVVVYGYFILRFAFGIGKVPYFTTQYQSPKTAFSIIVPFRNETKVLPDLLLSLSQINYPRELFEIIFMDDDSTDGFQFGTYNFDFKVLKNIRKSNSPKKDAIEIAVQHAKNEWIVTTDADCLVPENWLKTLDAFIREHNVEMIAGPVTYYTNDEFLQNPLCAMVLILPIPKICLKNSWVLLVAIIFRVAMMFFYYKKPFNRMNLEFPK
jgi:glycosyltransferase involved in cell wall biosynthesis